MIVTRAEYAERHRPLDRVYYRQKLISAAFGTAMISLDELQEALLWIYRAELGTLELAAERLGVDPSTVYRWQQKWARS